MTKSGNALMKLCAAEVIAVRPTEGDPSLIWREPAGEKNEATFAAFWLHQAAVYRVAKSFSLVNCMALLCDVRRACGSAAACEGPSL